MSFINTISHRISSRERQIGRVLARRDIFIWAAAILFLNQLYSVVKEMPAASLEAFVSDLLAIGIFQYLAWYVIFRLLGSSDRAPAAGSRDFLVTGAFLLLVFLPTSKMIWVAATGIAFYLWLFNGGDRKLRAETAVVGTILEVVRPGTVWHDNAINGPDGHGVVIINSCSSFHNLSLAMLCWLTFSRLRHQDWRARDFVIGGTIGITMILFNVARICLMAWDSDLLHYWHDGTGAQIYAIGASLTILLLSLYGSRPAERLR